MVNARNLIARAAGLAVIAVPATSARAGPGDRRDRPAPGAAPPWVAARCARVQASRAGRLPPTPSGG